MDVIHKNITIKKIKFVLVFFCISVCFISCKEEVKADKIQVNYIDNEAISVTFNSNHTNFLLFRKENSEVSVLGEFSSEENGITFIPVIPFTNGVTYQIKDNSTIVGEFSIKKNLSVERPKLISIYPKLDTVPENLLKMYFVFSKPMQEVNSALDFIKVINITTNTEEKIFLPLETELWNADHTELTLWLDPGRIKKDLIPNQKLGIPIKKGNSYELIISPEWSDALGNTLGKESKKRIVIGARDKHMPSEKDWKLTIPPSETGEALDILCKEPIDFMLVEKNMSVMNANNQPIEGAFYLIDNASKAIAFIPKKAWKKGNYTLVVQSTLEDLAGNNMNRLFDTDLQQQQQRNTSKTRKITFTVY